MAKNKSHGKNPWDFALPRDNIPNCQTPIVNQKLRNGCSENAFVKRWGLLHFTQRLSKSVPERNRFPELGSPNDNITLVTNPSAYSGGAGFDILRQIF
jgi:hypothetical protein